MEMLKLSGENFCCFDKIELNLKNAGLVWIGGRNEDTKAADNNGSGKSTIFKLLTWTLYGQTIDGEKGDKVIRSGAREAIGKLVFVDGKDEWTLVRTRKKGAPGVKLYSPDGTESELSKDEIQNRVLEMVGGLDFPAFKNTVLYGQNDIQRFSNPKTKDKDRKEMLGKILGTDSLVRCHEWAMEKRRDIKKRSEACQHEIDVVESKIGAMDLDGVKARRDEFDDETKRLVSAKKISVKKAKRELLEIVDKIKAHKKASAAAVDTDTLKAVRKKLLAAYSKLDDYQGEYDKLKGKKGELETKIEKGNDKAWEWVEKRDSAEAKLKAAKKELKRLSGDRCPVCTTTLGSGKAKEHVDAVKEKVSRWRKIAEKRQAKIDEFKGKVDVLSVEAEKYNERMEALSEKIIKCNSSRMEAAVLGEEIANVEKQESERENVLAELKMEKRVYKEDIKRLVGEMNEAAKRANPFKEMFEETKAKIKTLKAEVKAKRAEEKSLETEYAKMNFWVRGFSNQGLPSFIMDNVMPFITERTNHYLETLSDGDITMEFSTQREMKSKKETRDEISISWCIEGVEDSYPPSGGQQKKMEIATDFALMDLVAARNGGSVDILALDEVLDGLDSEGRKRVVDLLREIRAKRGSVFVISHDPDVSEVFEKSIMVTKKGGSSTLEAIS